MILKALYDYYHRCGDSLAPMNLSYEEYFFCIVIDEKGQFKRIEDLRTENGKGMTVLSLRPEERTSSPIAHYLGDNGSYVLGLKNVKIKEAFDYEKEFKANSKNFEAFVSSIDSLLTIDKTDRLLNAIHLFYQQNLCLLYEELHSWPIWKEVVNNLGKNITFRLDGDIGVAAGYYHMFEPIIAGRKNDNKEQICLITGSKARPVSNTYSTYIIGGKSNGKLISFQTSSGYDSYGKKSCLNAPISEEAEFKYTTALLHLLRKGSHNKFTLGKDSSTRTYLFWASSNSQASAFAEDSIFSLFGHVEKEDDPNARLDLVRKAFLSIYNGEVPAEKDDKFFILGLAPNSARIAVVYWAEVPLKKFASIINRHFEDMEIIDGRKDRKPYAGLHSILGTITRDGKSSDVTPNLPDAVVKSIFQGLPYPTSLFQSCIRRIRAEVSKEINGKKVDPVSITRAAIIKAYLNRQNDNNNQKLNIMLDKQNNNQGYLCGRLFAVLDKIQEDANGIHSIRERYMNSASATPSTVFATILNLSTHHQEKLAEGRQLYFEKLKQEIIAKLDADGFPTHLDLQDQGRFFVGYYHQRQDFFVAKEDK